VALDDSGFGGGEWEEPDDVDVLALAVVSLEVVGKVDRAGGDQGGGGRVGEDRAAGADQLAAFEPLTAVDHLTRDLEHDARCPSWVFTYGGHVHEQFLVCTIAIGQAQVVAGESKGDKRGPTREWGIRSEVRDLNTGVCGVVSACPARDEAEVRFEVPDQIRHALIIADSTIGVAADPRACVGVPVPNAESRTPNMQRPGTRSKPHSATAANPGDPLPLLTMSHRLKVT
jgi:hypothetical protein